MEGTVLLSLPEGILIDQIQITENDLVIEAAATAPTSCCPLCSQPSSSIHCHYRRTLRDVPCAVLSELRTLGSTGGLKIIRCKFENEKG